MTDISLIALAAGMARRYGSLKQVAAVGPGAEALLDHTLRDAAEAGVSQVVLVVRPEIHAEVADHVRARSSLPVVVVEQAGPGTGRARPWGAAEAVALALPACPGPAIVANADDYYGPDAVAALVAWLRSAGGPGRAALVTWPLAATLSPLGSVTRAICALGPDGTAVTGMDEVEGITAAADGSPVVPGRTLAADAPTSMNLWGLPAGLEPGLRRAVETFQAAHDGEPDAELPLPTALDSLVAHGELRIEALPVGSTWVGITHPDDLPTAQAAMAARAPIPVREP